MNLYGFFIFTLFFVEGLPKRNLTNCPAISISNGRVRYRQKGKIVRFMCNTGYLLVGDRYSVCVGQKWDNIVSRCVRSNCKNINTPKNGFIYPSFGGAVLNFFCNSGYELKGPNITYCDGAKWSNPLPSCFPSKTLPPLSCDFEQDDLCGWNHDPNHDFDWQRQSYSTPSGRIGTGPSYDHTKGPGKGGYYMYIESSARNPNDTARLISPVYNNSNSTLCFEFYYHMYGSATGSLRIYLKKSDKDWNFKPGNALFTKNGNQGDKWYRGVVVLGTFDSEFQIIIEGVRGPSYVSDIAVDDVKIITNCNPEDELKEEETTTEDFMTSETPISVESCEGRCNTNETQNISGFLTCDCDEFCFMRNRCCPDYFDFCTNDTTLDDLGEETTDTTILEELTTIKSAPSVTKLALTSASNAKITTIVKTPLPKVTKKVTPITTSTTTKITTWKPRPTLPPEKKEESKIVYVVPEESDFDEVPEVSEKPNKETEVINDYESDKTFDHQKIEVKSNIQEGHMKTVVFSVGVVFGVMFALVGMAFVAKRYQLCRCNRLKLNQSSNGDSQSDVRFLTNDEVLDFNLDYDSL